MENNQLVCMVEQEAARSASVQAVPGARSPSLDGIVTFQECGLTDGCTSYPVAFQHARLV